MRVFIVDVIMVRRVLPLLLGTCPDGHSKLPVPIIACGGIQSAQEAMACLNLGATAVQIDAVLWRNPSLLDKINLELGDLVTTFIHENPVKESDNDDTNLADGGDDFSGFIVSA